MERLPKWLLCVPLVVHWFWLGFRYRSLTLPSVLNPAIATGGLAGESKLDCLGLVGARHSGWVARTAAVRPGADPEAVRVAAGLAFPVIAKPDVGWCGYGVRRVEDAAGLAAYARAFPAGATWLLQAFEAGPGEAGVFYVRRPGDGVGRVVGLALRHQPRVVGDGVRTVRELVAACARVRGRLVGDGERVPGSGEVVVLSTVASLRVGGRYEDGRRLMSAALTARVDAIARSMTGAGGAGFEFGRFDVRFGSEAELRAGRFRIIEVNGAGSEAIECWDPALGVGAAFAGVFRKQALLFAMGAVGRGLGRRPVGVVGLARAWLGQQR